MSIKKGFSFFLGLQDVVVDEFCESFRGNYGDNFVRFLLMPYEI